VCLLAVTLLCEAKETVSRTSLEHGEGQLNRNCVQEILKCTLAFQLKSLPSSTLSSIHIGRNYFNEPLVFWPYQTKYATEMEETFVSTTLSISANNEIGSLFFYFPTLLAKNTVYVRPSFSLWSYNVGLKDTL
jgi:hypothetical protein